MGFYFFFLLKNNSFSVNMSYYIEKVDGGRFFY